jgi:trigger factor
MQVTETVSDGLRRSYAVTVPAADLESRAKLRLADLGKNLKLPGFRPGKVPLNLVRQRYGRDVLLEIMQDEIKTGADKVIADHNLRPAGQPRIAVDGEPPTTHAAHDLVFHVELEVLPEITLPDLSTISLVKLRAEPTAVSIDETLARLATQNRDMIAVEDRGAENGDVLTVDFTGSIGGVAFEGGAGSDIAIDVGGGGFIPGFTDQLGGMMAGDTRTIDVTFPEDYHAPDLAGKAAQFEIVAKKLENPVTPAIDDALAIKLGFEDLEKLREAVSGQMQREYDQMARLRTKRELLDILAESANFPAPEGLLDTEFGAIWQRVEADQREGRVDDDDVGKDEATLKAEYRGIADRRVRLGLLLAEIGRVNAIQVTEPELTQALRAEALRYPGQEMQVVEFFRKTPGAFEQLRGPIFEDKVVDYILEMAKVETETVTPEALSEAVAAAQEVPTTLGHAAAAHVAEQAPGDAPDEAA